MLGRPHKRLHFRRDRAPPPVHFRDREPICRRVTSSIYEQARGAWGATQYTLNMSQKASHDDVDDNFQVHFYLRRSQQVNGSLSDSMTFLKCGNERLERQGKHGNIGNRGH